MGSKREDSMKNSLLNRVMLLSGLKMYRRQSKKNSYDRGLRRVSYGAVKSTGSEIYRWVV